jgi:hypothetical protein
MKHTGADGTGFASFGGGKACHTTRLTGNDAMDHSADDRRWAARRKFWFPSGILVDRRTGFDRRSGADRRVPSPPPPAALGTNRRSGAERRDELERRAFERRTGPRRPSDRTS